MTTPNHIVAGTFFTGFWASFWNENIFSRWEYLTATIVCSLLPDIDHPKSPIGILFFPIAKWLDRKYGHRTITHSLFFLFGGTATLYLLKYILKNTMNNEPLTMILPLIFFFAVLSHLILDMVTVQGVPLFYPIKRNPCVIPGNQDFRLVSGKAKTEIVAFLIFCFMNFLCWDLYAKGFWTHYNQIFTTIEHLHFERANSPNFTIADYDFIKNSKRYKGKAVVLNSTETKCQLLINDTVFHLDYSTPGLVVKSITANKTKYPYTVTERAFINAPISELQQFVMNQIVSGSITSNDYFTTHYSGTQKAGNNISLIYDYNVSIVPTPSQKPTDKSHLQKQLAVKRQSLIQHRLNFQKLNAEYYRLVKMRDDLQHRVNHMSTIPSPLGEGGRRPDEVGSVALRNALENELIKINNKLLLMPVPVYQENIVTLEEIKQLQILIAKPDSITTQTFTANLSVVNVPKELKYISEKKKHPLTINHEP